VVNYPLFFSEQRTVLPPSSGRAGRRHKAIHEHSAPLKVPADPLLDRPASAELVQFTREQYFEDILKLRDDERERIGHELHDSAGQLLLYLQLSVARLKMMEAAEHHEDLIDEIQATARQIAAEIRSLAFVNHSVRRPPDDLAEALRALIEGFGKRTGCSVSFTIQGDPTPMDNATSLALLRIAQESLVNVHRHAHASRVTMTLTAHNHCLELAICDDGIGMPSSKEIAARGGVGVDGMRFRMEQIGGEFRITSPKRGTKVWAKLPLTHLP